MLQQLTLRDQVNARPSIHALIIQWREGIPLTPRALIRERVRLEWEARDATAAPREALAPLVETPKPDAALQDTPEGGSRTPRPPTLEDVTTVALDGFVRNAFFLVVDGRQVTHLDEVILLRPTSHVTFVRLLPLKGG